MYSGLAYYYCINSIAPSLPADTFLPFRSATQSNMQTQWLSLPPLHLSVSVSLQELSRVHAHEVLSVSWWEVHPGREQSSVWLHPWNHSLLHHEQTAHPRSRTPVSAVPGAGADALRPHTHTYHVLTHRHTQGFTRTATTVLHLQSHIVDSSRVWLVFGWGIRFFRRVIRFIPGVKESTIGLYWHCIDVLHACAEYILHHWTLKCLRITLGTAILLSMLQTLQMIDLTFEDKM